jgi:hypothetical protein
MFEAIMALGILKHGFLQLRLVRVGREQKMERSLTKTEQE